MTGVAALQQAGGNREVDRFHIFNPVRRANKKPSGKVPCHKWVDKNEKSRLTAAGLKSRGETTGETFSPTPTATAYKVFEAKALTQGWQTMISR